MHMSKSPISKTNKPLPRVTPDTEVFWQGCNRGQLLLAACTNCSNVHLPPGPVCPFCFSDDLGWKSASGFGHVSSWTIVYKNWFDAFNDDIPYNTVQVELDEGPRLTTNLIRINSEQIRVGMKVEVVFDRITNDFTLPRFKPVTHSGD